MAQLLEAPTEGYEDAIVVPEINANFELKHGLINLVQNKQFFGHDKEDPHAHIRYFNKITSTMKFPNVPSTFGKAIAFPFSLEGAAEIWIEKEPSIDSKHGMISVEDKLGYLRWCSFLLNCQHFLAMIYRVLFQEYVSQAAAANFNQGNTGYRAPISNQIRPPGFPPVQNNHMQNQGNNQNRYNQNRGNFNQAPAYQPPVNQGQVYRPQVVQPPAYQAPAYQAPAPQIQGVSKEDFHSYVKANDAVMRNMQTQGQNMQNQLTNLTDMLSKFVASNTASTSGTLPSNTVTNPKEDLKGITTRSGVAYKGPTIPITSSLKCIVLQGLTKKHQFHFLQEEMMKDVVVGGGGEKANDQIEKFYEIFRDLSFEISFTDALMLMPKFASTLKTLIGNKEKLSEMARTPLNENVSIGNLSLSELTPTCMTLELADRSISEPIGIAEDVYVTVGKFQFPADFRSRRFLNQRGPLIQSGPNFEVTQPTTIIDATELTSLIWLVKNTLKKFLVLKCDLEWQSHPYCVPIGSTSSHP
ncbi:hypothetical protein Tco_0088928 [Tanacetum coccineum]